MVSVKKEPLIILAFLFLQSIIGIFFLLAVIISLFQISNEIFKLSKFFIYGFHKPLF